MVFAPSAIACASAGQPVKEAFEPRFRAVDFLVQALGVVLRGKQLLAQREVLGAQPLAQRYELRDLGFERIELRVHASNYVSKFKHRQAVSRVFACIPSSGPANPLYDGGSLSRCTGKRSQASTAPATVGERSIPQIWPLRSVGRGKAGMLCLASPETGLEAFATTEASGKTPGRFPCVTPSPVSSPAALLPIVLLRRTPSSSPRRVSRIRSATCPSASP